MRHTEFLRMNKIKSAFFGFLGIFLIGCGSCVPGMCGCAISIWPSSWEEWVSGTAFISDLVGLVGMLICAIWAVVLRTKHRTIEDANRF